MPVTPDELVPAVHPIRRIRPTMVELALDSLTPTFDAMYAAEGRPSIPPEHLLKGCLLMALYSIRSERQFCERLQYDLLFKWFLGLNVSDDAFDHSSFAKNRRRLLDHAVSRAFFEAVLRQARQQHLLSNDHFTVDGTPLESWASLKSFQRKPNPTWAASGNPNEAIAVAAHPARPAADATRKWTSEASVVPTRPLFGHRPRCPAGAQGQRPRGQAQSGRAHPDGEPGR